MKNGQPHEWQSFDELPIGTTFAGDDERTYVVDSDSIIIFPKPKEKIVKGLQAAIIAKKI